MIKLSKRLETISSLVPINSKVVDIGCDHGLLDIYLYEQKIVKTIIATDVNENALENARQNIKNNGFETEISTRLGNGLDVINDKDDVDTVIISGMGSNTIIDILNNNLNKLKNINYLIIQSNTKIPLLREEVIKLGYFIFDEKIVEDNKKFYTIIKFSKGNKSYSKKELTLGPILLRDNSEIFQKYCHIKLSKLVSILEKLPKRKLIARYKIIKEIKLYK